MASLVLGAAGAALAPSGWAAFGWAVGSSVGSMLFPGGEDQEGPRLNDLQIQDSSYGKPIPIIYGRDRVAGNIIWSKPLEEVKNEESGKGGGPTSTTYNYFASFALGLCEGEITGVRRIWIANKLVYKYTDDATVEELLASNATIDGITVHTGSETQEPDPLIQADKGAANTPAFRGLAYLVFDRLDVGNSGQIPNISVEVVGAGSDELRGSLPSFTVDVPILGTGNQNYININKFKDASFDVTTSSNGDSDAIGYPQYYGIYGYTLDGSKISEYSQFTNISSPSPGRWEEVTNYMALNHSQDLTVYRSALLLVGVYDGIPVLWNPSTSDSISTATAIGNTAATTTKRLSYSDAGIYFEGT